MLETYRVLSYDLIQGFGLKPRVSMTKVWDLSPRNGRENASLEMILSLLPATGAPLTILYCDYFFEKLHTNYFKVYLI